VIDPLLLNEPVFEIEPEGILRSATVRNWLILTDPVTCNEPVKNGMILNF
jgi:hypothetical protein